MRLIEDAISDPDTCGVVINGPAGVGKSRIAREALAAATSKGAEARWVVGTSSAQVLPLGAFAAWVGPVETQSPELVRLVRGVIESLTSARAGGSVVVGVDNAHVLDQLSTFVLHQIVQRRAAKVILTIRDGERIPSGVQDIWRAAPLDRLDLQPLSMDETTALVSATLGGPLHAYAARRLWELTRGNALYLRNIVEQELADERLALRDGQWRWTGEPVMPPGLVELIEARIGALPAAVRDVIDVLAVGEPIELGALTAITSPAAVEEADMRGLIAFDDVDARVEASVAHPLYGQIRRERAAPTRLRRLRGLVAAKLAAFDDRDDMRVVVRRAMLSLDSDLPQDPDLLLRAAQYAVWWFFDLPLADRLAEAALRAGAGPEASILRGTVLASRGRGQEAEAVFAAIPRDELAVVDRVELAFVQAGQRLFTQGDPTGAKQLIDAVKATTPPAARTAIDALDILYWALMGKPDAALERSADLAWDQLDAIGARMATWGITVAAGDAGRTADAVAATEVDLPNVIRHFDAPHLRFFAADGHVGALLLAGRIAEAQDAAEALRRQVADVPVARPLHSVPVAGRAALGAGRLDTARSLLEPVVNAWLLTGDTTGWGYRWQIPRTIAVAMCGLNEEAGAALAMLEERRHPSWRCLDYERRLAHAWVAACRGTLSDAIAAALSAAETACSNGQFAAEVICLQTATQFGDRSGGARLRELEGIVEGPRAGLAARFAESLSAGCAAELASVSVEFEQMGDLIAGADAAAHAAMVYRGQGMRGSALVCAARAEWLAQQCGGASTPALRQATEPLPLTDREREVAMLLGQGLSSRAIAAQLTLSVRTVEGHVYRAMTKTGTTSREDLAALLRHAKTSG